MVFCTRKQKICFIWTAAGVIAIETCVFFIVLLIFTAEKFGTGEWEASNAGTEAVKSVNKGYLTFLPSQRNNITVDFTNPDGEYMRNMKIILDEYSKSKMGHCPKAAALQLGDCDDSYGINQGVFCLVARLENTGVWVPDDFLQTDKLPNYRNDFLPISCDIRATNASTYREGKPIDFSYEKELNNVWPASGFPKELFPLDKLTRNCYPAVTIKVDDPFVLRYPHEQITVTCRIWSYNSNQITTSKVSINVTLLHREDSLFASARKPPRLPDHAKHTASLSESTTTREATLPATTQITPATINIKPIDSTWPYPIAETIPHTSSTNEPSTFMETSVFNKTTPLSTDKKIYKDLSTLRASSHETTPRIVTEEASSAEASTRATPSPEEAVSSTQVTSTDLSTTASFLPPTFAEPEDDDDDITEFLTEKIFYDFPLTTPQLTEEIEFAASGDREEPIFEKLVHYSSTLGSSSVPLDTTQSELNFFDNDVDSDENHPGSLTNSSSLDSPVDSTSSIDTSLSELDTFSTLNADENGKHTQRWQESTTVTEAALHASTQVTPTSTSTTKLTDTPPTSIARSMPHTYSATTPPSLTESSVITKLHPLPSTETVTYTGFKNISASSHENTSATFRTEPAVLDGHPRAAPSMEETVRPTASKSTASFLSPTVATQQDFYTDSTPESTAETNFGFPLTAVQDSTNKFHWQATGDTDQPIFPKENYTSSSEASLLPLGTTRSTINLNSYENASFDEILTESVHVDLLDSSPTVETSVSQLTIISTLNSTKSDNPNPNENLNISMPTPTDTLVDSTSTSRFEHSYPLKTTLPTHDSQDNTTFFSPTEALPNTPSSLEPFPTKIATSSSTFPSNEEITASTYVSSQTPGNNEDSHYHDNSSDDGQYDDPILGGGEN